MIDFEGLMARHGMDFRVRGTEAIAVCPKCSGGDSREKCWSLNLETGQFTCNRKNHCGWNGNEFALMAHFGERREYKPSIVQVPAKPKAYKKPDAYQLKGLSSEIGQWFLGRKIGVEQIAQYNIDGKAGWIAFPVYSLNGDLVNIKWRGLNEKKFRNEEGAQRLPFGLQLVPPESKTLMITEGECDAMVARQYGVEAVISLPNGTADLDWVEPLWDWLERFETLNLCLDMDQAGRDGLKKLVNRLGPWRCRDVQLPHKDLNDCLMEGVTPEEIKRAAASAKDFMPDKLCGVADLADAVFELFRNRDGLRGVPTGFPGLNNILKGWRGGELTVWTGQNGSGKSTILGQEMVNQVIAGEKVCIGSFELDAARYLRWMTCQLSNEENPSEAEIAKALGDLVGGMVFVNHVGSIAIEELLINFEYAARRYGVRHFVVDSLVKLKIRGDQREGQIRAVETLCDFAARFDAQVHLVAHPRKGESDNDQPDKTAVKGAGEITDLAHNVIAIYRNKKPKPGQSATMLAVLKNREHGVEGMVPINVNPDTKRVTEAQAQSVHVEWQPRKEWKQTTSRQPDTYTPPPRSEYTGTTCQELGEDFE